MNPETVSHISITSVLMFGLPVIVFLILMLKPSLTPGQEYVSNEPDWSIPNIDDFAELHSPFHSWDPRIKIIALLIYCFLIVSIENLYVAASLPIIALLAIRMSELPFQRARHRILAMLPFLSMFLVIMPLTVPLQAGDTAIIIDPFTFLFNLRGAKVALLITLKACAIALMMELLLSTAPFPVTIRALTALKLPTMAGQMILLSHRYIFVFLHEAKRMAIGMQVRGYKPGVNMRTFRTMGNFLGMLFVRSFDRTQRVYDAMLSRGYRGDFPSYETFSSSGSDWAKGVFWVGLGIILVVVDTMIH